LWEPRSFDVCKNAATPMITMLSHSELDMEVSDAGMETAESNNCKGISRRDEDANVGHDMRRNKIFLQRWMEVY